MLQTPRLSTRLFAEVNSLLPEKGLLFREGTTVPSSTKNRDGQPHPEMTQHVERQNYLVAGMKS